MAEQERSELAGNRSLGQRAEVARVYATKKTRRGSTPLSSYLVCPSLVSGDQCANPLWRLPYLDNRQFLHRLRVDRRYRIVCGVGDVDLLAVRCERDPVRD